jgi:hypothetical protein
MGDHIMTKKHSIMVWDLKLCKIDDEGVALLNADGSIKLFNATDYLCEDIQNGLEDVDLEECETVKPIKKPLISARKVCEWVRREAYYGTLPNQDGEETPLIIEAANHCLSYLQYHNNKPLVWPPPYNEVQP